MAAQAARVLKALTAVPARLPGYAAAAQKIGQGGYAQWRLKVDLHHRITAIEPTGCRTALQEREKERKRERGLYSVCLVGLCMWLRRGVCV